MSLVSGSDKMRGETPETGERVAGGLRDRIAEIESALRRRMRIHPRVLAKVSSHPEADPSSISDQEQISEAQGRKPIVSIHGRDVDEEKLGERDVA